MKDAMTFGELLEATDRLSLEEQETLVDTLHRRMIERRRTELAKDIQEARQEFQEGRCQAVTPSELMKEISS